MAAPFLSVFFPTQSICKNKRVKVSVFIDFYQLNTTESVWMSVMPFYFLCIKNGRPILCELICVYFMLQRLFHTRVCGSEGDSTEAGADCSGTH